MRKGTHCTVVPLHDELAKGTLLGILRQTGLSRDDLDRLIRKERLPLRSLSAPGAAPRPGGVSTRGAPGERGGP
ncbi:MAG: hypothetical protein M1550_05070 [Deltaproteobacteria bacterium]|nr:hypothetical protein [Deltaproteobacteria bacterium]